MTSKAERCFESWYLPLSYLLFRKSDATGKTDHSRSYAVVKEINERLSSSSSSSSSSSPSSFSYSSSSSPSYSHYSTSSSSSSSSLLSLSPFSFLLISFRRLPSPELLLTSSSSQYSVLRM